MEDNNNERATFETNSILDVIHEKTANIEQATNSNTIKTKINEAIKGFYKREERLRNSTITIKMSDSLKLDKIIETIEKQWTQALRQISPTYWQDQEFAYCQFQGSNEKITFIDLTKTDPLLSEIASRLSTANNANQHYTRRMVKIELSNVRGNIQANKINNIINNTANEECKFTELKEGKANQITRARSITFKTNAAGIKHLLGNLDGTIPYITLETNIKTKLKIRINARPWTCRECFYTGQHQCLGKLCQKCSSKDHITKDCKSLTKYCSNCKKRGHRAKDAHCPSYLNEVIKEIRKMDIPIEYYADKDLRNNLINALQLK